MAHIAIGYGILLILLGAAGYIASNGASITALIPAFFGIPVTAAGLAALKEPWRKHAMHAAAGLAFLGAVGSARGLSKLPALIQGTADRPMAVAAQAAMFVLSALFLALCIRSFISARRTRT